MKYRITSRVIVSVISGHHWISPHISPGRLSSEVDLEQFTFTRFISVYTNNKNVIQAELSQTQFSWSLTKLDLVWQENRRA